MIFIRCRDNHYNGALSFCTFQVEKKSAIKGDRVFARFFAITRKRRKGLGFMSKKTIILKPYYNNCMFPFA